MTEDGLNSVISSPKRQLLHSSRRNEFADDNDFKFYENGITFSKRLENTVGKRKKCSLRAISPFPTVFSKGLYQRHVKTMDCMGKGYSLLNNIRRHVYYLTHSLTHHFGPSQIQRSCKRQLDIWLVKDFKKNLHRKHCGKR